MVDAHRLQRLFNNLMGCSFHFDVSLLFFRFNSLSIACMCLMGQGFVVFACTYGRLDGGGDGNLWWAGKVGRFVDSIVDCV